MLDPKKQLCITLTEPIAFLRTPDPSGRLQSDPNDPPTLVRGILTLNVTKPIEISSIEVELSGVLAISYPEAIGSRRVELPEKHKIYSSTVTIFRADQVRRARCSASVGPRLSPVYPNEDEHAGSASSRLPSLPRGRSERRSISIVTALPLDLGPTPPYTAAQSPTLIQSRAGVPGEHPTQTLEELRQVLRESFEGQPRSIPPLFHSPVARSVPDTTTHSDVSSTSNDSLRRDNDHRADNLVHSNSPLEDDSSFHNTTTEESSDAPPLRDTLRLHSPESIHGTQPPARGRSHNPSNTPASHSRLRLSLTSVLDAVREIASRTPSRSRSGAGLEERERGRTRVRVIVEEENRVNILEGSEGVASSGNGSQPRPNATYASSHTEHREHHLLGLGRVLGLEHDHGKDRDYDYKSKEHGESWREFKPGTYSYPISFLLPPHLPPTFSVPSGSLNYAIKGVAHRPGTFTSKLSCQVPLLVVASPAIGAEEGGGPADPGPLFVEKQWQGKLAYSFGLGSRLFLLGSERRLGAAASEGAHGNTEPLTEAGVEARAEAAYGTATLDLTLLPIEKVKVWRLDIFVDQRIKYFDERGRSTREDERRQVRLLEVQDTCSAEEMDLIDEGQTRKNKHKHKHDCVRIPLLPTPVSPHRSPLLRYLPPSSDPSILAGPGPYTLSANIGLPGCNDPSSGDSGPLHFTMKQKSSNVRVEHSLRLVMRVESVGDEDTHDHEEGEKKKLFDIAVQTPITVLSCRCIPEYQTLPRYSQITADSLQHQVACPCRTTIAGTVEQGPTHGHNVGNYPGHAMTVTPRSTSSFDSESGATDDPELSGHTRSRSPSRARRSGHANPLTASLHPHPHPLSPVPRETVWSRSSSLVQTPSRLHGQHHRSQSHSYTVSTSHVRGHSQTPPPSTPHPSRPPSPLARYERLVSGLESEAGEAPPSYESVASGP